MILCHVTNKRKHILKINCVFVKIGMRGCVHLYVRHSVYCGKGRQSIFNKLMKNQEIHSYIFISVSIEDSKMNSITKCLGDDNSYLV